MYLDLREHVCILIHCRLTSFGIICICAKQMAAFKNLVAPTQHYQPCHTEAENHSNVAVGQPRDIPFISRNGWELCTSAAVFWGGLAFVPRHMNTHRHRNEKNNKCLNLQYHWCSSKVFKEKDGFCPIKHPAHAHYLLLQSISCLIATLANLLVEQMSILTFRPNSKLLPTLM